MVINLWDLDLALGLRLYMEGYDYILFDYAVWLRWSLSSIDHKFLLRRSWSNPSCQVIIYTHRLQVQDWYSVPLPKAARCACLKSVENGHARMPGTLLAGLLAALLDKNRLAHPRHPPTRKAQYAWRFGL